MVFISEMVNYYRLQGKRLDQVMDEISHKYGYHADKLYSIFFKGKSGLEEMLSIMRKLHDQPLTEIAGKKVTVVEDYLFLTRTSEYGEEYIENSCGEYAHWNCVDYGRDLVDFLGYEIKEMDDENEWDY